MSKKMSAKTLSCAVGAALVGSLAATGAVQAAENPFGATQLESGYMQLASKEGSCGEGKCGGDKSESKKEMSCGEGKCGGDKSKKEGSCGEGKCGGDKSESKSEGSCGGGKSETKKEGSCGEGKCGGSK